VLYDSYIATPQARESNSGDIGDSFLPPRRALGAPLGLQAEWMRRMRCGHWLRGSQVMATYGNGRRPQIVESLEDPRSARSSQVRSSTSMTMRQLKHWSKPCASWFGRTEPESDAHLTSFDIIGPLMTTVCFYLLLLASFVPEILLSAHSELSGFRTKLDTFDI